MSSLVISENLFLLYSLAMGVFITFVYDIFRIWRRVCTHNCFFVSLEDILFWTFCAISVFYLMHTQSNGTLRWFAILGALAGMLAYRRTISPFFVKWVSCGISAILNFLKKILGIAGKPFRFFAMKGRKTGKKAANSAKRASTFVKKKLTRLIKLLRIVLCKQ
ncbi:MAG: spore cortex biosynthesis protein YabQ [Lachnospiraceae bacterium]